jgi:hypothetical protein
MNGDCGCDQPAPGRSEPDSRYLNAPVAFDAVGPVLGPYLGGGVVPSGLAAGGVSKPGGGLTPAVLSVATPDPAGPYPAVRHDFHFDFSTPVMIFQRDRFTDPALYRELGGLEGGPVAAWP